ncbi:MAG: lycopene cyclase domain-containing protein [candidate division KSB1 bacterium]|nr:lycopene cyclase domain-containing protein [candidate division KSB1 bacterium]MDZ7272651.1 lycopene cyclase domain-containing protein [candidate division KSB1 bacterium]MDZ7284327.1 lycopene cyclase domain-containing protein [candidate division KSB1 bacterium]MDZ7297277.1 lycopene cyclase domain-containing protein [candidate division KSB1 bacterium]MDZ7309396.1 lycopene cyclase domain-containing protein [candidate division KSB1 bacterium]
MKIEYLLFNLCVLAGPLLMSFEKKIYFFSRWRPAMAAILLVAPGFILWDAAVTGRHWWFNPSYTLDFRIAGLPLEEWLFFFTVPFAALFVWEVIGFYLPDRRHAAAKGFALLLWLAPLPGVLALCHGREYTGLMLLAVSLTAVLDRLLQTRLLSRQRVLLYFAATLMLNVICNGYLTARPVVVYNAAHHLGLRVGTIPIEDFGYGFALIMPVTILYEKFRGTAPA